LVSEVEPLPRFQPPQDQGVAIPKENQVSHHQFQP
jgi:hypothetical protein